MFIAPAAVGVKLKPRRIARPKANTGLLKRAVKPIVAMKKSGEWVKLKKPWLMSLLISPLCVLSPIRFYKIPKHAAVFAAFSAKLWMFFHAASVCCTVLSEN